MPVALITGGAGFIGSHLADRLLSQGYRVRALDSLIPQVHGQTERFPVYLDSRVESVFGDVRDAKALSLALDGVEVVFHLASLTGVGQSMYQIEEYTNVNIGGTATLLQAIVDRDKNSRPRRLVLASSRAVYGEGKHQCSACGIVYPIGRSVEQLDRKRWEIECPRCGRSLQPLPTDELSPLQPGSIYAITKKAQEEICLMVGQAHELAVSVLRFFNVYGPRQAPSNPYTGIIAVFLSRLSQGQSIDLYEDGQMLRDFVSVHDVSRALVLAGQNDRATGQVINVGSGVGTTIQDLAQELVRLTGKEISPRVAKVVRIGDIRHMVANTSKAQERLGFSSEVSLPEGLKELIEWFKAQRLSVDRSDQARRELEERGLLR